MGNIMILNASPRALKSNSRKYAQLFCDACPEPAQYFSLNHANHAQLLSAMQDYSDVLFVFPLYADAIPVTLLHFLNSMESHHFPQKPVISVLINCGFLEYAQNDIAVEMVELFCSKNGFPMGSVLKIGSGEAILNTPFKFLVKRKIRKLALSIVRGQRRVYHVKMPLTKRMFVLASSKYWIAYGKKFGTSPEQMRTMEIEAPPIK